MGRRSKSGDYIQFDSVGFLNAMRKQIKEANVRIMNKIYADTRANASSLPFKDNEVKIVGAAPTSDLKRKGALLDSIVKQNLGWVATDISNSLWSDLQAPAGHKPDNVEHTVEITAMGENYKDSHIGNYYEYGTGTKAMRTRPGMYLGDPNPFRKGKKIVSRSYVNSPWTDMGGNVRKSSGRGGISTPEFYKYIGEEIEAYRWFQKAFLQNKDFALDEYRKAINKVMDEFYTKYFQVQEHYYLIQK